MLFAFLNIYKQRGQSSNSVISYLRRTLKIKQIGFAGTLDPLAEGVLPVAVGKATKLIDYLNNEKTYIAHAKFGETSTTFDSEGVITKMDNSPLITKECVIQALNSFKGEISQKPPVYSAVHVNGKRLYELARKNITENDIDIPERKVFVSDIKLLGFDDEDQIAVFRISCSKGTYIRSIVSDLGKKLNSGAVMIKLVRISSSGFKIDSSNLCEEITAENVVDYLIPVETKVDGDILEISDMEFEKIRYGNYIDTKFKSDKLILVKYQNNIIGIGFIENNKLVVRKVFV